MILRNIVLCFILLSVLKVNSQEKISSFAGNDKSTKDLFTIVDDATKQTIVFFVNDLSLTASRFDVNLELVDNLTIPFQKKQLGSIKGTSGSQGSYYVYWSTYDGKEFIEQHFDFITKKATSQTIPLVEKEKIKQIRIANFNSNNILYTVTVEKGTNLLHFYKYQNNVIDKKIVDLSSFKFLNKMQQKVSFWDLYNENNSNAFSKVIQAIPEDTPPSLIMATEKKKSYVKNDKLTFTFDVNQSFTQLLTIDLTNFTATQKTYAMPFVPVEPGEQPDSNSFLVNDVLVQMKIKSKLLELTAKNLEDQIIQSITLRSDEEASFKNSEIIQESGSIESTRILGSSKQLIRKMHKLFPSVTGYYKDDKFYIVLGGVSAPTDDQKGMMGGAIGGFTGSLIATLISSNATAANLNSYADRKIVYIQSVFDKDFNHVPGAYKKLAFDKLRLFIEQNDKLTHHSTFKIEKDLYLLAFDNKKNEYAFYKFQD